MSVTMSRGIQPHNEKPASVWSSGGKDYDEVSRGIADAIEHCVLRLNPRPGERVLDLATGTGWTSRVVARRGATVTGVDIANGLLNAARATAAVEGLPIAYQLGDAEDLPFDDASFDAVVSTRRPRRLQPRRSHGAAPSASASCWGRHSSSASKRVSRIIASRAEERRGRLFQQATVRHDRWRRTSTRRCAETSPSSTTAFQPSSASACRVSTG